MLDTAKKFLPLNFALLANPVNWVIVFLMVALAGLAIPLILNATPTPKEDN